MRLSLVIAALTVLTASVFGLWTSYSGAVQCELPALTELAQPRSYDGERRPVLVELFTSEGCSSCPPADRQLTFLQEKQPVAGAEVVSLAFHVDYWDRLGWKDRYSSRSFSDRQNAYTIAKGLDSNYTPQMIVDGETQFVGSNGQKATEAVMAAAGSAKGTIRLNASDANIEISIDELPSHEAATVLLAVAEDGLETDVLSGENGGQRLLHTGVVRSLTTIGRVAAGEAAFKASIPFPEVAGIKAGKTRFVVFVQEVGRMRVLAVGTAKPAAN
ncbi:MAG: DUF1223 domain-containing protein [Pyrinomonadaceae bacterium]